MLVCLVLLDLDRLNSYLISHKYNALPVHGKGFFTSTNSVITPPKKSYNTGMKATLKGIAIALSILAMVIVVLSAVDSASNVNVSATDTYLKVAVVDLDNTPVHNAKVIVGNQSFYTDNKGLSPSIELVEFTNSYDDSITEWGTVTVMIQKDGYSPTFVFNCIVYSGQTRKLVVKIYPTDASQLPYVSYVETPPNEYINSLLNAKE